MKKAQFIGYLELSLAQFCIGLNIILAKFLIDSFSMYSLLFLRFLIGFLIALFCLLGFKKCDQAYAELKSLSRKDWLILFLQGICGGFLFNIFILWGLQHTTAIVAGILNSAIPAFVALFSYLILKEKLTPAKCFGILLCMIGIGILSLGKQEGLGVNGSNLLGIVLIILALIPEATFTIFGKLLKNPISALPATLVINFFNTLLFLPLCMAFDNMQLFNNLSFNQIILILLYGLSGGVLFFAFWHRGLKHVSANTASLFMGVMPIATSILAYVFLGEVLSFWDLVGMIFVMFSIYFGTKKYLFFRKNEDKTFSEEET